MRLCVSEHHKDVYGPQDLKVCINDTGVQISCGFYCCFYCLYDGKFSEL